MDNRNLEARNFEPYNIIPIKNYTGNAEEFDDYFDEYYLCANACDWGEAFMIKRLPLYLKGFALQAYKNIGAIPEKWNDLVKSLKKIIVIPSELERILIQKFRNRVQGRDETVGEFMYDLKDLAHKAFGDGNHIARILEDQFLNGVHSYIRSALVAVDYENADELLRKSRRLEANYRNSTKERQFNILDIDDEKSKVILKGNDEWNDVKGVYSDCQNNKSDRNNNRGFTPRMEYYNNYRHFDCVNNSGYGQSTERQFYDSGSRNQNYNKNFYNRNVNWNSRDDNRNEYNTYNNYDRYDFMTETSQNGNFNPTRNDSFNAIPKERTEMNRITKDDYDNLKAEIQKTKEEYDRLQSKQYRYTELQFDCYELEEKNEQENSNRQMSKRDKKDQDEKYNTASRMDRENYYINSNNKNMHRNKANICYDYNSKRRHDNNNDYCLGGKAANYTKNKYSCCKQYDGNNFSKRSNDEKDDDLYDGNNNGNNEFVQCYKREDYDSFNEIRLTKKNTFPEKNASTNLNLNRKNETEFIKAEIQKMKMRCEINSLKVNIQKMETDYRKNICERNNNVDRCDFSSIDKQRVKKESVEDKWENASENKMQSIAENISNSNVELDIALNTTCLKFTINDVRNCYENELFENKIENLKILTDVKETKLLSNREPVIEIETEYCEAINEGKTLNDEIRIVQFNSDVTNEKRMQKDSVCSDLESELEIISESEVVTMDQIQLAKDKYVLNYDVDFNNCSDSNCQKLTIKDIKMNVRNKIFKNESEKDRNENCKILVDEGEIKCLVIGDSIIIEGNETRTDGTQFVQCNRNPNNHNLKCNTDSGKKDLHSQLKVENHNVIKDTDESIQSESNKEINENEESITELEIENTLNDNDEKAHKEIDIRIKKSTDLIKIIEKLEEINRNIFGKKDSIKTETNRKDYVDEITRCKMKPNNKKEIIVKDFEKSLISILLVCYQFLKQKQAIINNEIESKNEILLNGIYYLLTILIIIKVKKRLQNYKRYKWKKQRYRHDVKIPKKGVFGYNQYTRS